MAFMNQDQPVRPANIANIVAINQGRRPLTLDMPRSTPLPPDQVVALLETGSLIVDARSPAAFGAGHIPGSYSIQLASSEFEQRVGWVLPEGAPLVLIAETETDAQRAIFLLAFLGLDQRVQGHLSGGMDTWINAGLPHDTLPQLSVYQLAQQLKDEHQLRVLDVRETSEWDDGHIQGAQNVNYKHLRERIDQLAADRAAPIAVVCAGGFRSCTASSVLRRNGFTRVFNVTGGMTAWSAAKLPMTADDRTVASQA